MMIMATFKEKTKSLTKLLESLSAPKTKTKKQPYDLKTIAENLILRYDPNNPTKVKNLPINNSVYKSKKDSGKGKEYSRLHYWYHKIIDSGNYSTMIYIITH